MNDRRPILRTSEQTTRTLWFSHAAICKLNLSVPIDRREMPSHGADWDPKLKLEWIGESQRQDGTFDAETALTENTLCVVYKSGERPLGFGAIFTAAIYVYTYEEGEKDSHYVGLGTFKSAVTAKRRCQETYTRLAASMQMQLRDYLNGQARGE